jgi:hypothetical protein
MNSSWGRDQWLRRTPEEWSPSAGEYRMAGDSKSRVGRTGKANKQRTRAKVPPVERPFDIWLQKQLHAMYDEIASEPLPGDLLGLIDSDAAKAKAKKEDVDTARLSKKKP